MSAHDLAGAVLGTGMFVAYCGLLWSVRRVNVVDRVGSVAVGGVFLGAPGIYMAALNWALVFGVRP